MIKNKYFLKSLFLLTLILLPWFNSDYTDSIKPAQLGTEDTSFYEINPCKVGFSEYLGVDFQSTYQDHYFFRYNDYSSINCFGKVSGIALFKNTFYISIGTNSFVNIILQSVFWLTLISFIKKDNSKEIRPKFYKSSHILTAIFLLFSINAEQRFYEGMFYIFDFDDYKSYGVLFLLLFVIVGIILEIFVPRTKKLFNYVPFVFLLIGTYSGFNLNFYAIPLLFYGISSILQLQNKKLNIIYIFFILIWINNASNSYSFYPDKLRGFTNSSYSISSITYWSIFVILLINGIVYLIKKSSDSFNFDSFKKNYSIASTIIFSIGILGANFPVFNIFNYYYFGQQKYGVRETNPFITDIFNNNVKIPWRGFYPSSESIGEFYGILICLIAFTFIQGKKISKLEICGVVTSMLGLYFANNKTVFLLVVLIVITLIFTKFNLSILKKTLLVIVFLTILIFIFGYSNLTYPYEFSSSALYEQAVKYQDPSMTSSALSYFVNITNEDGAMLSILSFFGYISYLLNRSELWGIFIARYNPDTLEFMFGSGPLTLGQHYGQIRINEPGSLLLPHSSLLSLLIYIGLVGVVIIFGFLLYNLYKNKDSFNIFGSLMVFYLITNLIKSDSINYLPSFIFFSTLLFIFTTINDYSIFQQSDDV